MAIPMLIAAKSLMGGGGADGSSEYRMIAFALSLIVLVPTMFVLFVPSYSIDHNWEDEINSIEQSYYNNTGSSSTSEQNIWTLTGIYTPYNGGKYGYTEDGWLYGTKVNSDNPVQYTGTLVHNGDLVVAQAPNGLFYYISAPEDMTDITVLKKPTNMTTGEGGQYKYEDGKYTITDTKGATVYSSVTFNKAQKSNIFFTTSSKVENDKGYYYAYTGYRYVFQPLSDYYTSIAGQSTKVTSNNTSLSLIWYEYYTISGIAGQLAVSGSDKGISYLTSDDIIRQFNATNYSSTFDMTFNAVKMHLVIRLDPSRMADGMSIADCYNGGYWSVMVYSDAVADSMASSTYEFSAENILSTLISLFTFRVAEDYNIDGWIGIIASMMITMPLYVSLLVLCLDHPELWMFVILLAAIQSVVSVANWFDFL